MNVGATSKNQNVIDISVEEGHTVHTRDGYYIVPAGVRHEAPYSMSWESASTVISSSHEFQQELKVAVEADAGVEGGFEFSASASSREMEKQTTGSPEAVARPRFPQNVACGFPAPTLFGSCFTALQAPAAPGRGGAV